MGTKMHCKSYFPGLYSMRVPNDDSSNSSSWPLFYENKMAANGQYYNGFVPRTLENCNSGLEKDTLKQKMLEHEAVFKNQVLELHRLYRIQRDMMEDFKRKEASMEPASSSSLQETQGPSEKARKWHMAGFPLSNSSYGVENFSSPTICAKGIPFQNGCTTKDSEVLGPRLLKVRKKLFDLHLPADEYVDVEEEENFQGYKKSDVSSYSRNGDPNNGAVDLNEPIPIEEARAPSSIDCLGRTLENGKTKSIHDGISINSYIENRATERGRLSHVNIGGSSKDKSLPLFCHPGQGTTNHVHPPPLGAYSNGYDREEKWREGFHNGLEPSDRCYSHSNNSHLEPVASQAPASHPFFSSSSFASSCFQSVSSWAHPSTSFTPKATTLETSINPVDAISRPLGEYWHVGDNKYYSSKLNKSFQSELNSIGVDHGFAIFPKGSYHADSRPAIDINLNEELPKSMGNENVIMRDLNVAVGISEAEDNLAALPWLKRKRVHVDDVTDTRSEQSRELSYHNASDELCSKNGTVRDLNQLMSTPCDSAALGDKGTAQSQAVKKILGFSIIERDICQNEILSASVSVNCFPERKNGTIDINVACEPDEQIAAEDLTMEKEKQEKDTPKKDHIDLNFCVSDSEDPSPPFYDQSEISAKINLEIDLEAPVALESENDSLGSEEETLNEVSLQPFEDQTKEKVQDEEVLRDAAETLVDLSSCPIVADTDGNNIRLLHEASSFEGALLLLANAISSDSKEKDDFEAMALELVETKEDDYMPKPFLPEVENIEARPLQTRTRRGHARRGRQWRDFQRDVLPGLASLSRHETTEDLQIFGGMMKATGHTWNSGLTRRNGARNGGGRGRRRAVVETVVETVPPMMEKLSSIEAGLEERSLTGWGKTTRRPRRQRCPSEIKFAIRARGLHRARTLTGQYSMKNRAGDMATSKQGSNDTGKSIKKEPGHRCWTTDEERVLLTSMKALIAQWWKSDYGFSVQEWLPK